MGSVQKPASCNANPSIRPSRQLSRNSRRGRSTSRWVHFGFSFRRPQNACHYGTPLPLIEPLPPMRTRVSPCALTSAIRPGSKCPSIRVSRFG